MVVERLRFLWDRFTQWRFVWPASGGVGVIVLVAAGYLVWSLIPTAPPDIWGDDIPDVTLFFMDEDFNRLPSSERLSLIVEFGKRFNEFDQDDAVLMAGVIGEMNREMRRQFEENARQLVADVMIDSAVEYDELSPDEQEAFLEDFVLMFDRMSDEINGRDRDVDDADRFDSIQEDFQKDDQRQQSRGSSAIQADGVNGFFEMYNSEISERSGAVERGKVLRFMRDLTRHMRGDG